MTSECCKLYSLIYDTDRKIWIFEFSLGMCSTELRSLVSSFEYLVFNGRQVLLGGIRLGGSATTMNAFISMLMLYGHFSFHNLV